MHEIDGQTLRKAKAWDRLMKLCDTTFNNNPADSVVLCKTLGDSGHTLVAPYAFTRGDDFLNIMEKL